MVISWQSRVRGFGWRRTHFPPIYGVMGTLLNKGFSAYTLMTPFGSIIAMRWYV